MQIPSILLLGRGQLGQSFLYNDQTSSDFSIRPAELGSYPTYCDRILCAQLAQYRPKVIINTAAYTDVVRAESEPEVALAVNRDGVRHLATLAKRFDALLVHFSTDYVFDGSGNSPWCEKDLPNPLNFYGYSKWLGERAIIESGCRYLILRTSWLHSPFGNNFIKTILKKSDIYQTLNVVSDQIGAPTSAQDLAILTLGAVQNSLLDNSLCGLYHITAGGAVSWFDYAKFILTKACSIGVINTMPKLFPVTSDNYPSLVMRPLNSQLDTNLFFQSFNTRIPDWRNGVEHTLLQLKGGEWD